MTYETFKVTCKKCGGTDILKITPDRTVFFTNHIPIISARFRPDMNWGFECGNCGNDSRVAPEEKNNLEMLIRNGSKQVIGAIAKSLTPKNENKFRMEQI